MYPVSANFHNLVIQDSPKTRIRIYFIGDGVDCTDDNDVQTNGTLLVGAVGDTDSNGRIAQDGVSFNEFYNPDKDLTIGTAVSSQIGMTLLNTDGALNGFAFGRCKVYLDVYDPSAANWLPCPMGVYNIELPTKRKVQLVSVSGYDQMQRFEQIADTWWNGLNWSAGLTLLQIVQSMAAQVGVSVSSNTASAIVNSGLTYTEAPFDCIEVTYREVLELIAEATGTVARFDRDGALDLKWFGAAQIGGSTVAINTDLIGNQCFAIDLGEYQVGQITQLKVKIAADDVGVTVGTGTNQYVIVNNLFLNGASAAAITAKATPIYNRLSGLAAYTPVSGRFIFDWSIEAGDIINITRDGTTYAMPIFQQLMTWRGGFVISDLGNSGDQTRPVLSYDERSYYRLNSEMSQKVGDNEIISKINQSPEQITIQANKLSLIGYTTINDGFKINLDGTFEANGATINGSLRSVATALGNSAYIGNGVIQLFDEDDTLRATMAAEQGGGQIALNGDSGRQIIDSDGGFNSYDENDILRAHISNGSVESGELIVIRDSSDAKVFAVADSYVEVNQILRNHNGPIEIESGIKTTGNVKAGSLNVDYGATIGGDLTANGTVAGQGFADLLFGIGNSIPSNTNCDSLTREGKYTCFSSTIAGTLTNPPYTTAFGMLVLRVAEVQRLVQVAIPNNSFITIKIRYYSGISWTEWKTLTPS